MEINWASTEFKTINDALKGCDFVYNGRKFLTDDVVNAYLAKGGA